MQEEEANEVPRAAASVSETTASPGTRSIVDTILQDVVSDNLASSMPQHSMLPIHDSGELEALPHDIALEPSELASDYQSSGDPPTAKLPTWHPLYLVNSPCQFTKCQTSNVDTASCGLCVVLDLAECNTS